MAQRGKLCGENDKRCRNCSTGVFALSRTRKPVIRAFGTKQNDPPPPAFGDQVRAQSLNAQLLDFDQTVVLESARISARPLGMDRMDLLLLGIIVGLAVLAIVALLRAGCPFRTVA
jgi:hypothetical protein